MLGQSDYLIELYSETSDSWETFRSSRKPADLLHTANLLCTGLEGLQSDATFWSGVTYLAIQAHDEEQHEYVEDSLGFNIDWLLTLEEDLLAEHFDRGKARRLVTDFANALDMADRFPDPQTV